MKNIFKYMMAIVAFAAVVSCSEEEILGSKDRDGYFLNKRSLSLVRGSTENLLLTIIPKTDASSVVWESEDTLVATVSQEGIVTAVGAGETVIHVKINQVVIDCTVEVTSPLTSVTLSQHDVELDKGETFRLSYEVGPDDINVPVEVLWSSSADSVLTVSQDGVVSAFLGGHAAVVIKANDVTDVCNFFIHCYPTGIQIPEEDAKIMVGDTARFTYKILPADYTEELEVTWSVLDGDVASVDQNGVVVGKKPGETKVIVTAGDFTAEKKVTVKKARVTICPISARPETNGLATLSFSSGVFYHGSSYGMYMDKGESFTVSVPEGYKLIGITIAQTYILGDFKVNTGQVKVSRHYSLWTPTTDTNSVTFTAADLILADVWEITYE